MRSAGIESALREGMMEFFSEAALPISICGKTCGGNSPKKLGKQ
jgi:hypothetical protein